MPRYKPEEVLDLVPGADDEGDGDRDEDEHHDVEAVAGEAALLAAQDAGVPLGAVVAVAQVDGGAGSTGASSGGASGLVRAGWATGLV